MIYKIVCTTNNKIKTKYFTYEDTSNFISSGIG